MIGSIEKRIVAQHRSNEASKRLETIPVVTDPKAFRSGRDFAAWIGIVPRQDSTGGKQKLGPISKQGDQYLRRILAFAWSSTPGYGPMRRSEFIVAIAGAAP
jgi:transposase